MVCWDFRKLCVCLSSFFLCAALASTGFAETGTTSPTEPVTTVSVIRRPDGYNAGGQPVVRRFTGPQTTSSVIPEAGPAARPTEPVTTTSTTR